VDILLENGSDGRIHPVTKYSPLYIAAYHGHRAIVGKLLTVKLTVFHSIRGNSNFESY